MENKNIVLCLDGTGNEYGENRTNVVLLHSMLEQSDRQVCYYDPGVGTFAVSPALTQVRRMSEQALGLAFGLGLRQNIIAAYEFIMERYEEGDHIYLYGFSRGAYTARVVAALLQAVGVLRTSYRPLVPYALRELQSSKDNFHLLDDFRRQFGRSRDGIGQVFLGVWDTVSSVSWLFDPQVYKFTANNPRVNVARHAVAIDERRAFFRTNLFRADVDNQDLKEVWFAGVHSDVGGGYPESEQGLSKICLEWMVVESRAHGLIVDLDVAKEAIAKGAPPNANGLMHRPLKGFWWAAEFYPKRQWRKTPHGGTVAYRPMLARRRTIRPAIGSPNAPVIHESVTQRKHAPPLPGDHRIEPWERLPGTPSWKDAPVENQVPVTPRDQVLAGVSIYLLICLFLAPIWTLQYLWSSGALGHAIMAVTPTFWLPWWSGVFALLLWPLAFLIGGWLLERVAPVGHLSRVTPGPLPHLRLGYSRATATAILDAIRPEGRASYRKALQADFYLMIPIYAGAFVGAWLWTATQPTILLVLAGVGVGADLIENLLLLRAMDSMDKGSSRHPGLTAAGFATLTKMLALIAAVVGLEICLFAPHTFSQVLRFFEMGLTNYVPAVLAIVAALAVARGMVGWAHRASAGEASDGN